MFNNRGQVYDSQGEWTWRSPTTARPFGSTARARGPYYKPRACPIFSKGELRSALVDFDQAIRLQRKMPMPSPPAPPRARSWATRRPALADYRRALEIAPDHAEAKEAIERLEK